MRRVLSCLGIGIGVIVVLILLLVGGVYISAQSKLNARVNNPLDTFTVDSSPARVARGQLLVSSVPGCGGCHSGNPQAQPIILNGAQVADAEALGFIWAPNLTPGGKLKDYSDAELERAIREGIAKDGRPLAIMPSDEFRNLSDTDVQDIIAYLRSQPADNQQDRPTSFSPLAYALLGLNQVTLSNQSPVSNVQKVQSGRTAARGEYLVSIGGCKACHGPNLDGENTIPGIPVGPNLAAAKGWTEQQFIQTMKTGTDPGGKVLNPAIMPWRTIGRLPDDDLIAIITYLKSR